MDPITIQPNRLILALDIGNKNGKAAVLLQWNSDPISLLPDSLPQGMDTTVYVSPDGTIGAYGARPRRATAIPAVKSRLAEQSIYLDDLKLRVETGKLFAQIAKDLVILANKELASRKMDPIYDIALTYPAAIAHNATILSRMKECVEAVEINGHKLNVVHMLSEPAGAEIDYHYFMTHLARHPIQAESYTVFDYDLGDGTFDTAIVTSYSDPSRECELLDQDGDPEIGGRVFTKLLYDDICAQLKEREGYTPSSASQKEMLRQLTVNIKHALSEHDSVKREISLPDSEVTVTFTRQRFEELIMPLLMRTREIVAQQLEKASQRGISIDAMILSGGSSQIPIIKQMLEELTGGNIPVDLYRPSMAVVYGAARNSAAIRAAAKTDIPKEATDAPEPQRPGVLTQYAERSYGIWEPQAAPVWGQVRFLIDSEATLPNWSKVYTLRSSEAGDTTITLHRTLNREAGAATVPVGPMYPEVRRFHFKLPPNTTVKVTLHMDDNRCIKVSCQLPDGSILSKTTFDREG